jgi:hypothetical protein
MQNVEGFCWYMEINFEGKLYAYFALTETGCEKCKYSPQWWRNSFLLGGGRLMLGNIGDREGGGGKHIF